MADSYFVSVLGLDAGPGGSTLALARIEATGLTLQVAGRADLRLRFDELAVSVDPADPERVLLTVSRPGGARVVVDDRRVLEQLAASAPAELAEKCRSLQEAGRRARRAAFAARALALVSAAAVLSAAAWFGYGALVSCVVSSIPPRYESKLSELADGADKTALKDPQVVAAVDEISARLLKTLSDSPYQFRVVVIPDARVNAYALPGGRIVVFSGLIAETESPDELAGVLAHEMQHVLRRHALRGLVRRLGIETLCAIALSGRGGAAAALEQAAPGLLGLRFDRAQEAEADRGGMEMLLAAGIPGDGMVRFFKGLSVQETGAERALNFASDHPTSKGRFEELERLRLSRPAPPPVAWGLDWESIRERCRAAAKAAAPRAA